MFGAAYFGKSYWGASYWGGVGDPSAGIPGPAGSGFPARREGGARYGVDDTARAPVEGGARFGQRNTRRV